MEKRTASKTDLAKLKDILKDMPEDRRPIGNQLFKEIQFMATTLTKLKTQVRKEGPTAMFIQGKQQFLREHPALIAYNKTIQQYSKLYKQIADLLPASKTEHKDELMDFLKE